jgi:hypothetical protein|nr:MAG TPA: hypothetical protein [Caudoviricetes sp.]
MFESFCKHKSYKIIRCEKSEHKYTCQCMKCGKQFELPKAPDEMYTIGQVVKLW